MEQTATPGAAPVDMAAVGRIRAHNVALVTRYVALAMAILACIALVCAAFVSGEARTKSIKYAAAAAILGVSAWLSSAITDYMANRSKLYDTMMAY